MLKKTNIFLKEKGLKKSIKKHRLGLYVFEVIIDVGHYSEILDSVTPENNDIHRKRCLVNSWGSLQWISYIKEILVLKNKRREYYES